MTMDETTIERPGVLDIIASVVGIILLACCAFVLVSAFHPAHPAESCRGITAEEISVSSNETSQTVTVGRAARARGECLTGTATAWEPAAILSPNLTHASDTPVAVVIGAQRDGVVPVTVTITGQSEGAIITMAR